VNIKHIKQLALEVHLNLQATASFLGNLLILLVGVARFELAAPASRRHSNHRYCEYFTSFCGILDGLISTILLTLNLRPLPK
jgi:hypothetical protein